MRNPLASLTRRETVNVLRLEGVIGGAARFGATSLTDASLASIKALLHEAQVGTRPDAEGDASVSAEQLQQACLAQREALADLRDWFFDWGTTLRTCFGPHDQARLGLVAAHGRAATGEADDGGEGGEREPDEAV